MIMQNREWNILRHLIGKKATKIIVPETADTVNPVEAIIALDEKTGLVIDSCAQKQAPLETGDKYPQLRLRFVSPLPKYKKEQTIDLSDHGEIVRRIEILNEEIFSTEERAMFTKAIHIDFTGDREITIARNTFKEPSLKVFEAKNDWVGDVEKSPFGKVKTVLL